MNEQPDCPSADSRSDALASVWTQTPAVLGVFEGPELCLVAWNEFARLIMPPGLGQLGTRLRDVDSVIGGGVDDLRRRVVQQQETLTRAESRITGPDAFGSWGDRYFDFTYAPWRNDDGSVRGVIASAGDVTEVVVRRRKAEEEATHAQEELRDSKEALATLQAALLPPSVPVVPGLQLGARYAVAEQGMAAGSDWFSALPIPDGRLALVVGEVVGHGTGAAAMMGQLRAVLDERLAAGVSIAEALGALNAFAAMHPTADTTTACVILLDPANGQLEYCTAGHPPPLMIGPDTWHYLPPTSAGALGSGRGFGTRWARLNVDSLLMLYSDGLVQRRDQSWERSTIEIGEEAFRSLHDRPSDGVSEHAADRVCQRALEVLTGQTGITDDITVLAAYRHRFPAILDVAVSSATRSLATVTGALDRWLIAMEAGDPDRVTLRRVLVELVTNSLEHAYEPGQPGTIRIRSELGTDGVITLRVRDDGRWRDPPDPDEPAGQDGMRGLGLAQVRQLIDAIELQRGDDGTQVTVRRRLSRPVVVGTHPRTATTPADLADTRFAAVSLPDEPGVLTVFGPVVIGTVDQLQAMLDIESRGGTRSITVDLEGVTHLASAGVRVLQQAQRACEVAGAKFTIICSPGSVAYHMLAIVGMPRRT